MKHGKKPTVRQKKYLQSIRLDPDNWLVSEDNRDKLVLIHRFTDQVRIIERTLK